MKRLLILLSIILPIPLVNSFQEVQPIAQGILAAKLNIDPQVETRINKAYAQNIFSYAESVFFEKMKVGAPKEFGSDYRWQWQQDRDYRTLISNTNALPGDIQQIILSMLPQCHIESLAGALGRLRLHGKKLQKNLSFPLYKNLAIFQGTLEKNGSACGDNFLKEIHRQAYLKKIHSTYDKENREYRTLISRVSALPADIQAIIIRMLDQNHWVTLAQGLNELCYTAKRLKNDPLYSSFKDLQELQTIIAEARVGYDFSTEIDNRALRDIAPMFCSTPYEIKNNECRVFLYNDTYYAQGYFNEQLPNPRVNPFEHRRRALNWASLLPIFQKYCNDEYYEASNTDAETLSPVYHPRFTWQARIIDMINASMCDDIISQNYSLDEDIDDIRDCFYCDVKRFGGQRKIEFTTSVHNGYRGIRSYCHTLPSHVQDILLKKILSFLHDETEEEVVSNEVSIEIVNGYNAAQFLEKIKKVVERDTSLKANFKENRSELLYIDSYENILLRDGAKVSTSVSISHSLRKIPIEFVD